MDEPHADERSTLIRAAHTVVRRSGFEGFKVQLVLRESGLSARTFYRHFSDKDELIMVLIWDEYQLTARHLRRVLGEAGADPVDQVTAWIRAMLLAAADPDRLPRTRLYSSHHSIMARYPDAAGESTRVILEPLEEAIARGQESGVFGSGDAGDDARHVARLTAGTVNEYLAGGAGTTDFSSLIDSTVTFAMRALRPS